MQGAQSLAEVTSYHFSDPLGNVAQQLALTIILGSIYCSVRPLAQRIAVSNGIPATRQLLADAKARFAFLESRIRGVDTQDLFGDESTWDCADTLSNLSISQAQNLHGIK